MRRIHPIVALAIPFSLAAVSLAPALLITPQLDVTAYAPAGYAAGSTDYWYPAAGTDRLMTLSRFNGATLRVIAEDGAVMAGGGFAGRRWTFEVDLVIPFDGEGADATLWFTDGDVGATPETGGLKVHLRRTVDGTATREAVIAVGTRPPYSVIPVRAGRQRIEIESTWTEATVRINNALAWTGDPGWAELTGAYPVIRFGRGDHLVSVVPAVEIGVASRGSADEDRFRSAFIERAVAAQDELGAFSRDTRTDAWTATALVMFHRRAPDPRVADALDRWVTAHVLAAAGRAAWEGQPGPDSIRDNVGQPGLALALWATDRDRADWLQGLSTLISAAGFTACDQGTPDWCRLGNLQPDGSVARATDPDAATHLTTFQVAETAAFVAGLELDDRRAWIRALSDRTYVRNTCQFVDRIGTGRSAIDDSPWTYAARAGRLEMLLWLGIAYQARPTDSVWQDGGVRALLTCATEEHRVQMAGPLGWRGVDGLPLILGQDVAAGRLLSPVTGIALDQERFDAPWIEAIDPATLRADPAPGGQPADLETAVAATMLALVRD
jgi:hypothetical protein